jgi:protein-tyrosine-phosphatase
MAEAFFNQIAEGKAHAISAGTQPVDKVNPMVVKVMQEIGIDISNNKPKLLTMEMVEKADKMITMGCGAEVGAVCPASFIETEDWALEDPKGKTIAEIRKIRDEIRKRVNDFLVKIISIKEA